MAIRRNLVVSGERDVLEEIECSTQDYPFYAIFVALTERLPHGLLLRGLARDTDPRATSVRAGRVLLDFPKLDALGWDVVARIRKVEQTPEGGVGIGLADLEEGEVGRVGGGEGELVDGGNDTCVCDGPFEVAGGLAAHDAGCGGGPGVAWV